MDIGNHIGALIFIAALLIAILGFRSSSKSQWNRSLRIKKELNGIKTIPFSDIKTIIQVSSKFAITRPLRPTLSFVYISENDIAIIPTKNTFGLRQTRLPYIINRLGYKNIELERIGLNEVKIILEPKSDSMIKAKTEIEFGSENSSDIEKLSNEILNWC